jgi:hypothetical protein
MDVLSLSGACVVRRIRNLGFWWAGVACISALMLSPSAIAQDAKPVDRIYMKPQIEVQEALDSMNAFATDRLPTLEGFVDANAATLDHFENPHYQLHIDVESQGISQTLVSVSAKITAWYVGQNASHSQYVVIPSNGRLEGDFLDRLSIYLEKPPPGSATASPGHSPSVVPVSGDASSSVGESSSRPSPASAAAPPADNQPLVASSDPAVLGSQIAELRSQRQALEQQERKMQDQITDLTNVSRNQKFLASIAIIRSAQTPIFAVPDETSKILFHADPEDEFEAIEGRDGFVHVKLDGGTTGWIRASQLRRPSDPEDEGAGGNANFSTANEEIKTFDGDWAPLKGKPTLFMFAQPVRRLPAGTLGQSQVEFAKQVFIDGYREANHTDQPAEGVVVVFLGEKGGVAAASLADIRRWQEGFITDKQFLERCSFDPPDSFRDTPGH